MVELETRRLRLVPITRVMAQGLLNRDDLGFAWTPGYTPLDPPALALIDSLNKFAGMHLFVDRDAHQVLGHSRFEADGRQPEAIWVSYGVAEQRRRCGYATEAVGAQVRWLLDQPRIRVIKAEIKRGHVASQGVLRKLGFREGPPGFQEVWELSRPAE
jgi:RimJ/RimL family protein N-acetyltransferase